MLMLRRNLLSVVLLYDALSTCPALSGADERVLQRLPFLFPLPVDANAARSCSPTTEKASRLPISGLAGGRAVRGAVRG